MELDIGYRGATRQSWREKDVRELVIRLVESNPRATRHEIIKLFKEQMREDDDYLDAAADYVVTNAMNAIELAQAKRKRSSTRPTRAETDAKVESMAETIKEQIIILNLEMPNGKRMRYCTGEEMARFGGLYARIAKRVGKTKRVGEVLSEAQVRGMLEAK